MLRGIEKGTRVWVDSLLWTVREVISPNAFQDFLVLERETDLREEDDSTSIDIITIYAQNEEFYSEEVGKEILGKIVKVSVGSLFRGSFYSKTQLPDVRRYTRRLTDDWLSHIVPPEMMEETPCDF